MATQEKTALVAMPERRSILMAVASRYGMEAAPFEATLRATVFPANGSREDFAAFLVVANEHQLNPLTKEIYAYPKRGGGIQALVGVDGWITLINRQALLDGIDFEIINDDKGALSAIACSISRKDRAKPVRVIETLAENTRPTEPWKMMPHRMLRHRALIQCARIAFGLAGIMDEDEARGANMIDVTPRPKREDFTNNQSAAPIPSPRVAEGGAGEDDTASDDPAPPVYRKIPVGMADNKTDWQGFADAMLAAIAEAADTEELGALQRDNLASVGAAPPVHKRAIEAAILARAGEIVGGE